MQANGDWTRAESLFGSSADRRHPAPGRPLGTHATAAVRPDIVPQARARQMCYYTNAKVHSYLGIDARYFLARQRIFSVLFHRSEPRDLNEYGTGYTFVLARNVSANLWFLRLCIPGRGSWACGQRRSRDLSLSGVSQRLSCESIRFADDHIDCQAYRWAQEKVPGGLVADSLMPGRRVPRGDTDGMHCRE